VTIEVVPTSVTGTGLVPTGSGTAILLPADYGNLLTNTENSALNGGDTSSLPLLEELAPTSDLASVYTLPYDPNYQDEVANATQPVVSSPAYQKVSTVNWKMWIALGVIGLGLVIFRHKIGKTIDKLV
jgi:hypothetical protein